MHAQSGQETSQASLSQQVQKLTEAMAHAQAQLAESQRQLEEMHRQLVVLQRQLAESGAGSSTEAAEALAAATAVVQAEKPAANAASVDELRERLDVQEAQIATHEQAKVESESRYPVKVTGMLLFNGFVNTRRVDMPATPTLALSGEGSTGAAVRQTILGFDARGPHLFGAESFADLRVDFSGSSQGSNTGTGYAGTYGGSSALLRLRTAHAVLHWDKTEAWFALDRPVMSPDTPTSLTAVAEPALAWSGNLWTWNPQMGATREVAHKLRLQAALMDVGDGPYSVIPTTSGIAPTVSAGERSRWPGVESRISLFKSGLKSGQDEEENHFGVGGYFAPHRSTFGYSYDAWAATIDGRIQLPARLEFSGSVYRGLALGGLGGGAYKDFAYRADADSGAYYVRALDDVGGWAQLKEKVSSRLEFNAAFGLDEIVAHQFRRYVVAGGSVAQNLAANRTFTGNVIYSPSAYLLFSLEYRHLESVPVVGASAASDVIGLAAGYRF